jgi:hypothetical protein
MRIRFRFVLLLCLLATSVSAQTPQPCNAVPAATALSPGHELDGLDGEAKCLAVTRQIVCKKDGTGYLLILTVTNNTGSTVTHVLLTPPVGAGYSITPQMPPIPGGSLANGQTLTLPPVTVTGGQPSQQICFAVTFMTKERTCCTVNVCVTLPNCCATVETKIECNKDGSFTYVLSVTNNTLNTIQHIYLYPPTGIVMNPSYFPVSLGPGATVQLTTQITGAKPGAKICFDISMHTAEMKSCCTFEQCITLPTCGPDVSLEKHFEKGPEPSRGTYVLTVKNQDGPIAPGTIVKISDAVPAGVTLTGLAGTSSTNWSCTPGFSVIGPATLTCNYTGTSTIPSGALLPALNLSATLASAGGQIGIYQNCALVSLSNSAGPVAETNPDNNRDCAVTNTINPSGCENSECPDPVAVCKQDVLLVIDASQSIGNGLPTVRAAIGKFLQAMQNKGGRVNIFSFSNQPFWTPITSGWTVVTSANASTLGATLNLSGSQTNWDNALHQAYNVVLADAPNLPFVIFVTDGDPNASDNAGGLEIDNTGMPVTAATEAVQWINAIRAAGSPLIGVGFGQVATAGYLDAAFTGNSSGSGNVNLETSSVIKMNTVAELPGVLGTLGGQMCGLLSLDKSGGGTYGHIIATGGTLPVNDPFSFMLEVTNNSNTPMSGIEVQDQVPIVLSGVTVTAPIIGSAPANPPGNLIKWSSIALAARTSATLSFTGNLVKTYTAPASENWTNYAQVTVAPPGYSGTTANNMNPTIGPASEADESVAAFGESVHVDACAGPNKPDSCYLRYVTKTKKNPEDNCTPASAGGPAKPCTFTINVGLGSNYIPSGATITVADSFSINNTPVSTAWAASVSPSLCTVTQTTVSFTCNHAGTSDFSGDVTVNIPAGVSGTLQNCVTVTITSTTPTLNISRQVCAAP